MKYEEGMRVRALVTITEDGRPPGDPDAEEGESQYIYANKGDEGFVVHVIASLGSPIVRWDDRETATLTVNEEIEVVDGV